MATSEQLKLAIDTFVDITGPRAQAIVNGANDATVETDNGILPTFAKSIKDFEDAQLAIIADNLATDDAQRVLSAAQGVVLKGLIDNITTLLASDDNNFDELQELVDFIKENRGTLDSLSIANVGGLQNVLDSKANGRTLARNSIDHDKGTSFYPIGISYLPLSTAGSPQEVGFWTNELGQGNFLVITQIEIAGDDDFRGGRQDIYSADSGYVGTRYAYDDGNLWTDWQKAATEAALALKPDFTSPKSSLVDADGVAIFDSQDAGADKSATLTTLWTWITGKLAFLTSLTVGGAWNFSSTTRPTSNGTGNPSANSLVTKKDVNDITYGFDVFRQFYVNMSSMATNAALGGVASANAKRGALEFYCNSSAGSYGRAIAQVGWVVPKLVDMSENYDVVSAFTHLVPTRPGNATYIQIGANSTAGQTPGKLTQKGWGFEVLSNGAAQVYIHNGTATINGNVGSVPNDLCFLAIECRTGFTVSVYSINKTGTKTLISTVTAAVSGTSSSGQLELARVNLDGISGGLDVNYASSLSFILR